MGEWQVNGGFILRGMQQMRLKPQFVILYAKLLKVVLKK